MGVLRIAVALLLLVAAAAVFLSPVTNLPCTALRAQQTAFLLFFSIIMAARHIAFVRHSSLVLRFVPRATENRSIPISGLVSRTCILLC
jgi:hypothetical protein